jgi:hypothetical protein
MDLGWQKLSVDSKEAEMPEQNEGVQPTEEETQIPESRPDVETTERREISEAEKKNRLELFDRLGQLMLWAEEGYDEQLFEDLRKVHSDFRDRLEKDGIDYMRYPKR